jgi:hypothetical protein
MKIRQSVWPPMHRHKPINFFFFHISCSFKLVKNAWPDYLSWSYNQQFGPYWGQVRLLERHHFTLIWNNLVRTTMFSAPNCLLQSLNSLLFTQIRVTTEQTHFLCSCNNKHTRTDVFQLPVLLKHGVRSASLAFLVPTIPLPASYKEIYIEDTRISKLRGVPGNYGMSVHSHLQSLGNNKVTLRDFSDVYWPLSPKI